MSKFILSLIVMYSACSPAKPWTSQISGTTERLRGVSAVSETVVWASGNHGTVLRTTDGGTNWHKLNIPDSDSLDFRDIDAMSDNEVYVMSIGPGPASRIYHTTDGGQNWTLCFQNSDPRAFYDAMAFWDYSRGMAMGDAVEKKLTVIRTNGTTEKWTPVTTLPDALEGEGGFAASGTCITTFGNNTVWIGSGVNCAKVYRSNDRGETWVVASAPIFAETASSGIFSLRQIDDRHGVAVGGDFQQVDMKTGTSAFTTDGGNSWIPSSAFPAGFRSCVVRVPGTPIDRGRPQRIRSVIRFRANVATARHDGISCGRFFFFECGLGRRGRRAHSQIHRTFQDR